MRATPINTILGNPTTNGPEPEVGMGATILMWSDRYPATIVEVLRTKQGKIRGVAVQEDIATVVGEWAPGTTNYTFERDPNAGKQVYTLRKSGVYVRDLESLKGGTRLRIGERLKYSDPHF